MIKILRFHSQWGEDKDTVNSVNGVLAGCSVLSYKGRPSAWVRDFNIREPIYPELCREFYATYEFGEVCAGDELQSKKIISFRLGERAHSLTLLEFARKLGLYHAEELEEDDYEDRLIPDFPVDDVQRVSAQRASMQDLYERMGSKEIKQEAIERMEYRQSYHWNRYQGVFEHMARVNNVLLQGAYNPPGYAQPQYD
ncbi:hypothetical protein Tco_1024597 [Tanacetum coccineum]